MASILLIWVSTLFTLTSTLSIKEGIANYQRTQIFVYYQSIPGQNIFIRGGTSGDCDETDPKEDPCSLPIVHLTEPDDVSSSYYQWSQGDDVLDWYGAEEDQGDFEGLEAGGTPLMWTTWSSPGVNDPVVEVDGHGYTSYNRFGEHYWFVDLDMDCSNTVDDWFEFKVYILPVLGWEPGINQYDKCAGEPGRTKPYASINHLGLCGKTNVFVYDEGECSVYDVPNNPDQPPQDTCGHRQVFDEGGLMSLLMPNIESSVREGSQMIVNGDASPMGWWPWQGVLQYGATIGGCAGVLVHPYWAITAGHCVRGTDPNILRIRFGEQSLAVTQGNEQSIDVTNIFRHQFHDNVPQGGVIGDYDVAMLELATPADLDDSYVVNTACLPTGLGNIDHYAGNPNCYATGFGDTRGTGDSYRLYEANVPVWEQEDCANFWGTEYIGERQVCMGTNTESACGGDSGGPLVCWEQDHWELVGITSWGTSNCQDGPSVYMRISGFLDWMQAITGLSKEELLL